MLTNIHADKIKTAQAFIILNERNAKEDPLKPRYHFSAPVGWINDPNGLVFYKGEYHIFYQHNPYGNRWGSMYWGHAKSRDLIKWEHLPIALAPSEPYDDHEKGGCFSGSAIVVGDVLMIIYTGMFIKNDGTPVSTQNIAYSKDGIVFEKYSGNPVIANYPEEGSVDFRDPKVWKYEGKYYCVIGSGKNNVGKALLYSSKDMFNWEYIGTVAQSDGSDGRVWECPDVFNVENTDVLTFSPIKAESGIAVYYTGKLNYMNGRFNIQNRGQIDYGFDYYAPQSMFDDKGRRIMIGWLGSWDWFDWFNDFGPSWQQGWCGHMSIPRQVTVGQDGRLRFFPVEEINNYCDNIYIDSNVDVNSEASIQIKDTTDAFRISAKIDGKISTGQIVFDLRVSDDKRYFTRVILDLKNSIMIFDRTNSDGYSKGSKTCPINIHDNIEIEIYVDSCSIEIFIGGGETCFTGNIFSNYEYNNINIGSIGGDTILKKIKIDKIML